MHFNVTQYPTQAWLSRQLTEGFPGDTEPRYLLRDRDTSYGLAFRNRVQAMSIEEIVTAPSSERNRDKVDEIMRAIARKAPAILAALHCWSRARREVPRAPSRRYYRRRRSGYAPHAPASRPTQMRGVQPLEAILQPCRRALSTRRNRSHPWPRRVGQDDRHRGGVCRRISRPPPSLCRRRATP